MDTPALCDFLIATEPLGPAGRAEALALEITANGGSYIPPLETRRSSHLFEISLHGVSALGATEQETVRNWFKAATTIAQPQLIRGAA